MQASDVANLCSPRSQRIIKRQLALAADQTFAQARELANQELEKSFSTADFREGVAHFLEKRPPDFPS